MYSVTSNDKSVVWSFDQVLLGLDGRYGKTSVNQVDLGSPTVLGLHGKPMAVDSEVSEVSFIKSKSLTSTGSSDIRYFNRLKWTSGRTNLSMYDWDYNLS